MKPLRHRLLPSRSVLGVLMFTLPAVCLGSFARAQATNAQIGGRVIDQTGAVVQNATIVVLNVGTGVERTVSTSSLGEYVIPSLPVGTYKMTTAAARFKNYAQSGIILENGQSARLDVTLEVGSANATVEVTTSVVQVDTSSAAIRTEIDNTQIKELPLNTRNTLQLITLVPGVGNASSSGAATSSLPATVINQRSGPTFNVNGSRVNGSQVSLDGAIFVTGLYNRPANLTNPDSIGEFSLLTNSY